MEQAIYCWLGIAASLWALVWKGIALWKAAGKKEQWWFIAHLVINTLGIFEILYIFIMLARIPPRRYVGADEGLFQKILSAEPTPCISNPPRYLAACREVGFIFSDISLKRIAKR